MRRKYLGAPPGLITMLPALRCDPARTICAQRKAAPLVVDLVLLAAFHDLREVPLKEWQEALPSLGHIRPPPSSSLARGKEVVKRPPTNRLAVHVAGLIVVGRSKPVLFVAVSIVSCDCNAIPELQTFRTTLGLAFSV